MKRADFGIVAVLVVGLAVGTLVSCAGDTEADFRAFLKDYEAKVMPLEKESGLTYFRAAVSGSDADYKQVEQAQVALKAIHSDTAAFARVKAFRESSQITDPLLKRQLDILYRTYLGNQIDSQTLAELVRRETDIEQKFNTYRTDVNGKLWGDNQVDSALRYSRNSAELEATWLASKRIGGEVAKDVIALAKLRNSAARTLGFDDYYEMKLALNEQDQAELAALFDELDRLTSGPYTILKGEIDSALAERYGVPKDQLRPWHYQNRFFQEAPTIYQVNLDRFFQDRDVVELSRGYYAGIGLPVDSILAGSDLYEKPGKYQHAQCMDIDRSGDVRMLCNVRPDYYWMNTMLHELGHGVYSYYHDPQMPWLLRDAAHSLTTEAIAEFFGKLAANPYWLNQVAGVPTAVADSVAVDCARTQRLEQLVFARWAQVVVRFERALYADPDQDLNKLWWDLVQKYQGLSPLKDRNEPDWAAKIHIATSPVYYHNYVLGELLASQLAATIGGKVLGAPDPFRVGFANDPRIGAFLTDSIFKPGALYPWNELIERATGEKLTPVYFTRQFIEAR